MIEFSLKSVKKIYLFLFVFTALTVFSELSFALQAVVVKGNRVLFSLEPLETKTVSVNSVVIAADKSAQVKIIQIRGARAIGQVVKGTAKVNTAFRVLTGEAKKTMAETGFLAGVSSNTMTIKTPNTKMQGTGFNIAGFFDYRFLPDLVLRGVAGYETFKATGAPTATPTITRTVSLNYLTAHAYAQYDISQYASGSRYWLGMGVGFLYLSSGSSDIIETSSLTTNQVFILATGMDIATDDGKAFPIQLDYFLYPDGDIKTQQINFRLGYKF
ncbi:hypothetical protein CIK05_15495 [Bdellovibrio sp. qaytius]|nr:hypothetical protein CIK05_15495 [Bdellovibrio sp. qaytius]